MASNHVFYITSNEWRQVQVSVCAQGLCFMYVVVFLLPSLAYFMINMTNPIHARRTTVGQCFWRQHCRLWLRMLFMLCL